MLRTVMTKIDIPKSITQQRRCIWISMVWAGKDEWVRVDSGTKACERKHIAKVSRPGK